MRLPVDMTWFDDAPCVGAGKVFFPAHYEREERHELRVAKAIEICRTCPHMLPCRAAAQRRQECSGVWGGIDMDAR